MANYYSIATPDEGLKCTRAEAEKIQALLEYDEEVDEYHGFSFDYEESMGMGYLGAEECANWDCLPDAALDKIAALIRRQGLAFLEIGVAFTCSKPRPGSNGGTAFRIMPDGTIVNRIETWPGE